MKTTCRAPAKLILSGEHAVLYGCPALSLAIDLPTECVTTFHTQPDMHIAIHLTDYHLQHTWHQEEWLQRAIDIEARYLAFSRQQTPIEQVCLNPFDLIILTLWHFHQLCPIQPGHWHIQISSQAWPGRGLGSSAAVITSLLKTLFFMHQLDDNPSQLLGLAKIIEARQHGKSSGLDPLTLIEGGLIHYQPGQPAQHLPSHHYQAWLIDTGAPDNTTGECVSRVKQLYANQPQVWQGFKHCTDKMHQAWLDQNSAAFKQAIDENQQRLVDIGVVPASVQNKLAQLNQYAKGVSKVCGAGSLQGDHAGVVMGIFEQDPTELCHHWQWRCQPIQVANTGVFCVAD